MKGMGFRETLSPFIVLFRYLGSDVHSDRHPGSEVRAIRDLFTTDLSLKGASEYNIVTL